jgi:hypothetical protein
MATPAPLQLVALTPEHARRIGRIATAATGAIAFSAAALSYHGLHALAVRAGVPGWLAWLLPVTVDGLVVAGLAGGLYATLAGLSTRYSTLLVLVGVSASIAGNLLAAETTVTGRAVAVLPPVVLALAVHQSLLVLRHRASLPPARARRNARAQPAAVTASPAPEPAAPAAARTERATRPAAAAGRTAASPASGGTREQVARMLADDPALTGAEVARRLGVDPSWARALLRQARSTGQQPEQSPAAAV